MTPTALDAGLDQFAAYRRDERHKLAKLLRKQRLTGWWHEREAIRVLVEWAIEESLDQDTARELAGWVCSEPWKYRAEYVLRMCRRLDPPPQVRVRIAT